MFEALLEIFVVSAFFGGPCSEEDPLERFARLPTIVRAREEALLAARVQADIVEHARLFQHLQVADDALDDGKVMGRIDARGSVPAMRICSYRNWQLMSDISGLTAMSASDTLYPRSRRSRAVFRGTSDVRNVPSIMRLYPMMESASTIASTIRPAHAAVCAGESMPYWAQI